MSDLLDVFERVPFAVWVLLAGVVPFSVLAWLVYTAPPSTKAERDAIRDEYLAWRHPRRVHRGRK